MVRNMKKIEAIIRPEKVTETIKELRNIGITSFTVSQVVGRGKQKDQKGVYRGKNYKVTLHPKVKLEIVLSDYMVKKTVETVMEYAHTGEDGDGKVFVYPVFEAYNIRTKEMDDSIDELIEQGE